MYGRALERMSRDARTAMAMLGCSGGTCSGDYDRAVNLVRQAAKRERRALGSATAFVTRDGPGDRALKALLQQLPTPENAEARLAASYAGITGAKPPALTLTARERELGTIVPSIDISIQAYLDKRSELKRPPNLHALMAYETINFVDGANSYLEIFRAVSAEADAAGQWYYGPVRLEDVSDYLDSAKAAGITTVKTMPPSSLPSGGPRG
jgi:hypothetical protein